MYLVRRDINTSYRAKYGRLENYSMGEVPLEFEGKNGDESAQS